MSVFNGNVRDAQSCWKKKARFRDPGGAYRLMHCARLSDQTGAEH